MGNNLMPCSIEIGYESLYHLTAYIKFIKIENIDENDIDKLFDYKVSNCQKERAYKIHSIYD